MSTRFFSKRGRTLAHSPQPIRHLGFLSFSVIIMHKPVLCASQNSNVRTFRACRAAAYTAMRDKDRAMLLLSCCLRCTPWPLGSRFAFNRFIVSLSLRNYRIPLSNYGNSLGTILSYRYRTIISKLLIRCPPLVEMHQLEVTKSQL